MQNANSESLTASASPASIPRYDFSRVLRDVREVYWPWIILAISVFWIFWPLFYRLPGVWLRDESYYAHGPVVPFCAAFIVWDRWPNIRNLDVRGSWWALPLVLLCCYLTFVSAGNSTRLLGSVCLMASLASFAQFIAGWRITRLLMAPILYLAFGLPIWDGAIDRLTQPLQKLSTEMAFRLLALCCQSPIRGEGSTLILSNYTLDVGIPCSGLKLLLAVASIVTFFLLVAHLKPWAGLVLAASAFPLSLLVNGIRIAMIGLVGNYFGSDAGASFHDYSGYISLVICFAALYQITKVLGWK